MRSIFDAYLPSESRPSSNGPRHLLNADEAAGVRMKGLMAQQLPIGQRCRALDSIGREYGISRRTVYRYVKSRTFEVVIGEWRARFTVTDESPRQSSAWERT